FGLFADRGQLLHLCTRAPPSAARAVHRKTAATHPRDHLSGRVDASRKEPLMRTVSVWRQGVNATLLRGFGGHDRRGDFPTQRGSSSCENKTFKGDYQGREAGNGCTRTAIGCSGTSLAIDRIIEEIVARNDFQGCLFPRIDETLGKNCRGLQR